MTHDVASRTEAPRQEPLRVATLLVLWTAAGLLGLIIVSLITMFLVFWWRTGSLPTNAQPPVTTTFPDPRLQIRETQELARIAEREDRRLHGGATIPIEQAMQRIIDRGTAAYDPLLAVVKEKKSP
jgi:hypothetical protein